MNGMDYEEYYRTRSSGLAVAEVEQNVQPKKRVVVVKVARRPVSEKTFLAERVGRSAMEDRAAIITKVERDLDNAKARRELVAKYDVETELREARDVELLVGDARKRNAWKLATFGTISNIPVEDDEFDTQEKSLSSRSFY